MAVGFGALLITDAAFAAPSPAGPGWDTIAQYAIGLVAITTGAYARRTEARVEKLETYRDTIDGRISAIREAIAQGYYTKPEIQRGFERLDEQLAEYRSEIRELLRGKK